MRPGLIGSALHQIANRRSEIVNTPEDTVIPQFHLEEERVVRMNTQSQPPREATEPHQTYLDWKGAESYTRLSRTYLRRQVAAGNLQAIRLGGRTLFRREDLDAFLERFLTTGPVESGRGARTDSGDAKPEETSSP
jgi:excisionase family DNA binding protein